MSARLNKNVKIVLIVRKKMFCAKMQYIVPLFSSSQSNTLVKSVLRLLQMFATCDKATKTILS